MFVTTPPAAHPAQPIPHVGPITQFVTVPDGQAQAVLDAVVEPADHRPIILDRFGQLRLDGPFAFVGTSTERWEAHGWLSRPGRFVGRHDAIAVEFTLWGRDGGELAVRPRARSAHRWSLRRQHEFGQVARAAVDELHDRLQRAVADVELRTVPEPRWLTARDHHHHADGVAA